MILFSFHFENLFQKLTTEKLLKKNYCINKEEKELKKAIISLTEILMLKLEQNRVVIVFKDDTIMLEQNENINPDIEI